ncbi:MAG: protein translocase subunit SecD [Sphingomonadaceae bacterium]
MLDFPPWKIWLVALTLLTGLVFSIPNFFSEQEVGAWPSFVPSRQINLGLDLRGGSHILIEASEEDIRKTRLEVLDESIRSELRQADGGAIGFTDMGVRDGAISFTVRNPADTDRAVETMRRMSRPIGQLSAQRDLDVSVVDGNRVVVRPTDAGLKAETDLAMGQAVDVIRRRIDELGTREPNIVRQGATRIVVQVPGLQDPAALKALLGKTAKLEFKLVDMEADPAMVAQGRAPPGSQVLPSIDGPPMAVKRRAIITGDQLIDAQPSFDQGQAVVSFRFDSVGGRRFGKATQENVGKPFAIILDGQIISAPRINSPILGGAGIITGNFTTASANELAIMLRSGKLPVELAVIEERTVGPDLGADSIRAGAIASVLSIVLVAVFMILTYGRFGVYSVIALFLNAVIVVGVMSMLGATLTLPGIAGFVLTIGAAVDANVLINERIREELRRGRNIVASVQMGYKDASRTIFDANVTNVIAAVIMFWFGSGPIKGFAVVLTIGIITSVFTAVTVTRLFASLWLRRARPQTLVL